MKLRKLIFVLAAVGCSTVTWASSHREGPSVTTTPKVDGTDFYLFKSYGTDRQANSGYVTLIANYQPLQDPNGGPNYFSMDSNALYEIHIDNNGDAVEDLTFQFRFQNVLANGGKGISLPIGVAGSQQEVAIPLVQAAGGITEVSSNKLNLSETFTINLVSGDRRQGAVSAITKASNNSATFEKPVDYIGEKTLGNAAAYETYAQKHVHTVNIPNCSLPAKVFVGQRQEAFAVNLGPIFDLVNAGIPVITNRAGFANAAAGNSIQNKNVTTLALEVHQSCLTGNGNGVIGGWTTASLRQVQLQDGVPAAGHQTAKKLAGRWAQVSRLGQPLVNEVVIGLKDKDLFNASEPANDAQFLTYVSHPTLPRLLEIALGTTEGALAPSVFPRSDLITVFLTGVEGVNQLATVTPSEMLRLNTAIAPTPIASMNTLGVIGGDNAGFPNGRRPFDDVVDIALTAALGKLCEVNGAGQAFEGKFGNTSTCNAAAVPLSGATAMPVIHDAVAQENVPLMTVFPYLNTPNPGAKN
jgi:hypothetical protein